MNRSQHGRAGDNMVSPFRLDDGRIVVVNRGFVPLGVEDVAPEPTGEVTVIGRVHPSDVRRRGQLSDPGRRRAHRGPAHRPRPARAAAARRRALPLYVDLVEPAADGFPEPVAAPELSEKNHLSYAGQWFIFAACVVVGWVLAVRKSISRPPPPNAGQSSTAEADLTPL